MPVPWFVVDAAGTRILTLDEAVLNAFDVLTELFGADLSAAPQTPQGQIAGAVGLLAVQAGEALVAEDNARDLTTAIGAQLEAYGSILDIRRTPEARSQVTATVTGVAGTGLPAKSVAETAGGAQFQTVSDVTLSPAGVPVEMEAVDAGPVEAAAGTLTRIVTVVSGWETVTNPAAATVGRSPEPDVVYRALYQTRTARNAVGHVSAVEAAVEAAGATRGKAHENPSDTAATVQEFTIRPYGTLILAEGGTDTAIRRAVETTRGQGVPVMTAIRGGPPDDTALSLVSDGTVTWAGTAYTGLDLTSASTGAARAAALTTLLDGTGVTVAYIDAAYVAQYVWFPDKAPTFGSGTVDTAFGLDSAAATGGEGPFVRARVRNLTVTLAVTQQFGFPADGLQQIRTAVTAVVEAYPLGGQVWSNDLLAAAEAVSASRVTAITVTYAAVAVSGVEPPADVVWALPAANLTITLT